MHLPTTQYLQTVARLEGAANYGRLLQLAGSAPLKRSLFGHVPEAVLVRAAMSGLRGPSYTERLTRAERSNMAQGIRHHSGALAGLLEEVLWEKNLPYQFQAMLDGMALDAAVHYEQTIEEELRRELEKNDVFHFARFAIYDFLLSGLPDLLETIESAAEWWSEEEQFLAKPNHPNAERLYMIRRVTEAFFVAYGKPMRELTLELTSVFFDCSDISEADLSRLAPVQKINHPLVRTAD